MDYTCPNGHTRTYRCHQPPPSICAKCEKAAEVAAKKKQKDFQKQQKRDEELREHAKRIAALDAEIEAEQEQQKDREAARQRADAIAQKQKDLADAKARAARKAAQASKPSPVARADDSIQHPLPPVPTQGVTPQSSTPALQPSTSAPRSESQSQPQSPTQPAQRPPTPRLSTENNDPLPLPPSKAEQEWQRQKDFDGADNEHIDAIMTMTGLEKVKDKVLSIKAKIDTSQRQGTSVKDERFNVALLGNPGTGTSA